MKIVRRMILVVSALASLTPAHRLACTVADGAESSAPTTMRAADFIGSIGVNTHLAWDGAWANFGAVEGALAYLGIANIRDSVPTASTLGKYYRLASKGIRFNVVISGTKVDIGADLARINRLLVLDRRSVVSVEGVNEYNVNHAMFNGEDSFENFAVGPKLDKALSTALHTDARWKDIAVVASSMANAGSLEIEKQGSLSRWVDASNWHAYFGHGDQPYLNIRAAASNARATAPGRSVFITETGYYTAVDAMDWGGGGIDEDTQAKMTLNLLLDAARAGVAKTYLYELMENHDHPASDDLEDSFGIFRGDGSPKKAAVTLHNLVGILSDKPTRATALPVPLPYVLRGVAAEDHSLLLVRSDGAYDLVLWNETKIWDETGKHAVPPKPHLVTVELGTPVRAEVFDPLVGEAAVKSIGGSETVDVSLGDHPMVIAISPFRRTKHGDAKASMR